MPAREEVSPTSDAQRFLRIYLGDHWAGQAAGRKLAERCLHNNRGTPVGEYLERFLEQLVTDADLLAVVMGRVGVGPDRAKEVLALAAERLGRFKPNGRLLAYSDLSRVLELEGLVIGVEGKAGLWRALADVAETDDRLEGLDFEGALRRARTQRTRLDRLRRDAARLAFVPG